MEFEKQSIKCTIFWDTEKIIKKVEAKINEINKLKEKQYYAQDILLEAKSLLRCSDYNVLNSDCLNCHYILRRYFQEYKPISSLLLSTHSYSKKEEWAYWYDSKKEKMV